MKLTVILLITVIVVGCSKQDNQVIKICDCEKEVEILREEMDQVKGAQDAIKDSLDMYVSIVMEKINKLSEKVLSLDSQYKIISNDTTLVNVNMHGNYIVSRTNQIDSLLHNFLDKIISINNGKD